ncbi:MAG: hypothetical protein ISS55_05650 [Dehalococcoidales bacterium]|nr:hypothetical protein [Dehalococcoidales bacterium]
MAERRYLLEAKVLEVGEGNSQLHREIIADWAFGIRDYQQLVEQGVSRGGAPQKGWSPL